MAKKQMYRISPLPGIKECIDYMKSKNFNVFFDMDYEYIQDNRAPMSDVVFINGEDL